MKRNRTSRLLRASQALLTNALTVVQELQRVTDAGEPPESAPASAATPSTRSLDRSGT